MGPTNIGWSRIGVQIVKFVLETGTREMFEANLKEKFDSVNTQLDCVYIYLYMYRFLHGFYWTAKLIT